MENNCFIIPINGLQSSGENVFKAHADKEFFAKFDNREVLDADLSVEFSASKRPDRVDIVCSISGTITVECDRCGAPVAMAVERNADFRLRFPGSSAPVEDPYEEVFLPPGSSSLDLGQEIYDYSLLALPLQKTHKEGGCDAAALAFLSAESENSDSTVAEATSSPFAGLARMLNVKN